MNFIQIVGKVKDKPVVLKDGTNEKYSLLEVDVTSNFRDSNGKYLVTTFPVRLWRGISETLTESYVIGLNVSVKGRVEYIDHNFTIIGECIEIIYP